jgi:hypothetical protein
MDGMNLKEAWEAARKVEDPYLALYGLLLTEFDIELLHRARVWGIDDRDDRRKK